MTDQLATKISKAALEVGGKLEADKTNREQNYNYLSADKILSICGQALFKEGIVLLPEVVQHETIPFEYSNGTQTKRRWDSRVEFLFHLSDGTDTKDYHWFGLGSDYLTPDKALYKAITSGHKYFLMKLLCVGAGNEDGEHENDDDEGEKQNRKPAQRPAQPKPTPPPTVVHPTPEPKPTEDIGDLAAWWPYDCKRSWTEAMKEKDTNGVLYITKTDEELDGSLESIKKAWERPNLSGKQQAELLIKKNTIEDIKRAREAKNSQPALIETAKT